MLSWPSYILLTMLFLDKKLKRALATCKNNVNAIKYIAKSIVIKSFIFNYVYLPYLGHLLALDGHIVIILAFEIFLMRCYNIINK